MTLDRLTSTLAGGEAQRIQLATSLGSHLVGALYVLDEPSIGLHPRDTDRLIQILKTLRDLGNTLVVVEHDPDTILAADYVIDLGPGAGEHGGKVIFAGTQEELLKDLRSLTARYLRNEMRIAVPAQRRRPQKKFLRVFGAHSHNLKNVDMLLPLGMMVVVTGVSGSGKSTLVYDVLYKALQAKRTGGNYREVCDRLEGDNSVLEVEMVDQSPIGRTPTIEPGDVHESVRCHSRSVCGDSGSEKAELQRGRFLVQYSGWALRSVPGRRHRDRGNALPGGRRADLRGMPGARYKSSLLEVKYHGKTIHEVLQLTVREALAFFATVPKVTTRLRVLDEVGLGYLRLGQSATTLSGGEAQRLKLAAHLTRQANAGVLYIFDEPTTGLHFDDIQKLLNAFRKLLDAGASVLIIEHNLDVMKSADWIIDMGPEGGTGGGRVIAAGTPEQVARNAQSHTAKFLARALQQTAQTPANGHGISPVGAATADAAAGGTSK